MGQSNMQNAEHIASAAGPTLPENIILNMPKIFAGFPGPLVSGLAEAVLQATCATSDILVLRRLCWLRTLAAVVHAEPSPVPNWPLLACLCLSGPPRRSSAEVHDATEESRAVQSSTAASQPALQHLC